MPKLYTAICTYRNCDKLFRKSTQAKADQALRMHAGVVHKKNIRRGHGQPDPVNPPVVEKRKYTRRSPAVAQEVQVNFCPACGCNLHRVAVGMALSGS